MLNNIAFILKEWIETVKLFDAEIKVCSLLLKSYKYMNFKLSNIYAYCARNFCINLKETSSS